MLPDRIKSIFMANQDEIKLCIGNDILLENEKIKREKEQCNGGRFVAIGQ